MTKSQCAAGFIPMWAKGLQLALIASPVLFAAAPSHAGPMSRTFTGFTEAFDSASWTSSTAGGSTVTFQPTTLTLFRPKTVGVTPETTYVFNTSAFETTYKPVAAGARAVKFLGGTLTYNWSWSTPSPAAEAADFNFQSIVNSSVATEFSPVTGQSASGSSGATLIPSDSFGFVNSRTGTAADRAATGTISNFTFVADYVTVPGPLPLAGAAAAFAWSRRLRQRLKSAQGSF